jgi:diguanylate cyclase (GGDEF)-like protein
MGVNWHAVVERLPQAVVVLSAEGVVRHANPAARILFDPLGEGADVAAMADLPGDLGRWIEDRPSGTGVFATLKDGEQAWSGLLHVQDARDDPQIAGYVVTLEDTRPGRQETLYDPLTALPTMLLVHDRAQVALASADREGEPFAVAFFDLDGFKAINDTHGHDVGDQVLVAVAARLSAAVRPGDTVGRYGGDESVLILPRLGADEALAVVGRILETVNGSYEVEGITVAVSASAGVCVRRPEQSFEDCLRHADTAMHAAKVRGRGRVELARRGLSEELRREREELERLAHEDERTGLPNDASFELDEDELVQRAYREGTPFGVVFIDIDCFHAYNARYTHLQGNRVLRQVAVALERVAAASGGRTYRYGGEEFAVLFLGLADLDRLAAAGEEMRREVEALAIPNEGIGANEVVTISVGVANSERGDPAATTLAADQAMLEAKAMGRNAVRTAGKGASPA